MKIALLTVFDDNYRAIAERTMPSMRRYAEAFGMEFMSMALDARGRPHSWGKIPRIREVLQSGFDYCFYIDPDAMFVRFDDDIRNHLSDSKDVYMCWHDPAVSEDYCVVEGHFNLGVGVWRNSPWTLDFLDRIWGNTDFIHHKWLEQAATLDLLGYRSLLVPDGVDDPDPNYAPHVQRLSPDWNVLVAKTFGPDPIIRHFAGRSMELRLADVDREIYFQALREKMSLGERYSLARQLSLISYQVVRAEERADRLLADHNALLRSRSGLAKSLTRAFMRRLGFGRA